MILTDKDIERLSRKGVMFIDGNGALITPKEEMPEHPKVEPPKVEEQPAPIKEGSDNTEYLKRIIELLGRLLYKPEREFPKTETPIVNVEPAPVVVQPAPIVHPPKPIRKWNFKLTKNNNGQTTEITATALE